MKLLIGISIVGLAVVSSSTYVLAQGGRGARQGWGAGADATQSGSSAQNSMRQQMHRHRHGIQQGPLASCGGMGNGICAGQANSSDTQSGANGQRGIVLPKRLRDGSCGALTVAGQAAGTGPNGTTGHP